jgi:hypothetical protein
MRNSDELKNFSPSLKSGNANRQMRLGGVRGDASAPWILSQMPVGRSIRNSRSPWKCAPRLTRHMCKIMHQCSKRRIDSDSAGGLWPPRASVARNDP